MRLIKTGLYGGLLQALRKLEEYIYNPHNNFNVKVNHLTRSTFFVFCFVSLESPKSWQRQFRGIYWIFHIDK